MTDDTKTGRVISLQIVRESVDKAPIVAEAAKSPTTVKIPPAVETGLPEECPVEPLGVKDGACFYLDSQRQLRPIKTRDHSALEIVGLFGSHTNQLHAAWPRADKSGKVTAFDARAAAEALIAACGRQGVIDLQDKLRGPGAWRGDDGELILHLGNRVWIGGNAGQLLDYQNGATVRPGRIGAYVYPAGAAQPYPSNAPAPVDQHGAGAQILKLLRTWPWKRAEIAPHLILGWICAAMIGGALSWRPLVWVTGGRGTGKSTLQEILKSIFGGALLIASDASAAALWQLLGYSTLPVVIDEAESEEDGGRLDRVVKLARMAASGGLILRGGADHAASKFLARCPFMFASILVPPLSPQDKSRIAVLELGELGQREPLSIQPAVLRELGAQLRRRLADAWPRFGDVLGGYRAGLQAAGHTARGADQYGTLLALVDVALMDAEFDRDAAGELIRHVQTDLSDWSDDAPDEIQCLGHLMTSTADVFRQGERKTIGEYVRAARDGNQGFGEEAQRIIETYGLKIVHESEGAFLAVATRHRGLAGLFKETHWRARPGAGAVWPQALMRLPKARRSGRTVRFGTATSKAILIPLDVVLPESPDPDPRG